MRPLALFLAFICFFQIWLFVMLGGFETTKGWLAGAVQKHFTHDKGGVPVVYLSWPILLAGLAGVFLVTSRPFAVHERPYFCTSLFRRTTRTRTAVLLLGSSSSSSNNNNMHAVAFFGVILPLLFYTVANLHRKLSSFHHDNDPEHQELDYKIMELSNAFAITATIALSLTFVPVARHSAILQTVGWSTIQALPIHIWLGRLIVICVTIHGAMYMSQWKWVLGESIWSMILPPGPCWSRDSDYQPVCHNERTDCTCYHHFRNLTGVLALICLWVLFVSSLGGIRRTSYALFYRIHVLAVPLLLVFVVVHWNRIMLYIGGGLLYYLALSVPVWMENKLDTTQVRVAAMDTIPAGHNHSCVSITIDATRTAMTRYRPGNYVYLSAPTISNVKHPFTINRVETNCNTRNDQDHSTPQLRIMFRTVGPFTQSLATALTASDRTTKSVPLYITGYHGTPSRLQNVLRHDRVVMIAGGIGITPYLSLLHDLASTGTFQNVTLHWICRDEALIRHVCRNYLNDDLLANANQNENDFVLQLNIHHTGNNAASFRDGDEEDEKKENDQSIDQDQSSIFPPPRGTPFHPSKFAAGTKTTYIANLTLAIMYSITCFGGLQWAWYSYQNIQDEHEVFSRIWSFLGGLVLAVAVSAIAVLMYRWFCVDEDNIVFSRRRPYTRPPEGYDDEDELELMSLRKKKSDHSEREKTSALEVKSSSVLVQKEGRPSSAELLECLSDARSPAVFMCGPTSLMNSVREAIGENWRFYDPRQFLPAASRRRRLALYEEHFFC